MSILDSGTGAEHCGGGKKKRRKGKSRYRLNLGKRRCYHSDACIWGKKRYCIPAIFPGYSSAMHRECTQLVSLRERPFN